MHVLQQHACPWEVSASSPTKAPPLMPSHILTALQGCFLVRENTSSPGEYVLSIRGRTACEHIRIVKGRGGFGLGSSTPFQSVQELIEYVSITPSFEAGLARGMMEEHTCCISQHASTYHHTASVDISFNPFLTFGNPTAHW
jgi:hypothetical protein